MTHLKTKRSKLLDFVANFFKRQWVHVSTLPIKSSFSVDVITANYICVTLVSLSVCSLTAMNIEWGYTDLLAQAPTVSR